MAQPIVTKSGMRLDQAAMHITHVMGVVQPHGRTRFPDHWNGWTDCAENWCVVLGPLATHFTRDKDTFPSVRVTVHTF